MKGSYESSSTFVTDCETFDRGADDVPAKRTRKRGNNVRKYIRKYIFASMLRARGWEMEGSFAKL